MDPKPTDLNDPFYYREMGKAAAIIKDAITAHRNILVYGDYDVDGVCALTIISSHLVNMGASVLRFVPDRKRNGYGLNMEMAEMIAKQGIGLVITVDNGITAVEEVKYLRAHGIETIVTDHHEPGEVLPECGALLDAKCSGESYPYKELCGAGVALKLVHALSGLNAVYKYIDLAALATVADMVPLTDENRTIVKLGLSKMNQDPSLWVKSVKRLFPEMSPITSYHLGFVFGPMINACGRLANAKKAVEFLMETEESESIIEAIAIKELNDKRKDEETKILKSVSINLAHNIIIASGPWEQGVVGLASSRITEKYCKPSLMFSFNAEKNLYIGSGRSVEGVNLFELVGKYKALTVKFGGHKMAIGLSVEADKFKDFVSAVYKEFDQLDNELFIRKSYYTEEAAAAEIRDGLMSDAEILEPCGYKAPSIRVMVKDVKLEKMKYISGQTSSFVAELVQGDARINIAAYNPPITVTPNISYNIITDPRPSRNGMYRILAIEPVNQDEANKVPKNNSVITAADAKINSDEAGASPLMEVPDSNYGTRAVPLTLEALGVTDKKAAQFNKVGIYNSEDLVNYFPKRYMDFRRTVKANEILTGEMEAIIGVVKSVRSTTGAKNCTIISCTCEDSEGQKFSARWFNQAYIVRMLTVGTTYIFCGNGYVGDMGYPSINVLFFSRDISKLQTLVPAYKKIPGMSDDYLKGMIQTALARLPRSDYLEKSIVDRFDLVNQSTSVSLLHSPNSETDIAIAQRRKVFDSLFKFNFILKNNLRASNSSNEFPITVHNSISKFMSLLPYELTNDQKATISDIVKEMSDPSATLNALVQGDVGCGKTIIAYILGAVMAENGYQSCIAAPTEVLAKQHFDGLSEYAEQMGLNIALLTGSTKAREKKAITEALAAGQIDILIGTHAIFQPSVKFNSLGLAVIDEQHKFGVEQRNTFLNGEYMPHIVTMSATPIPRTLAMATFGDHISVYNIKTKPMGRKDVITTKTNSDKETHDFILREIQKGHQAYIVCPLIDESEKLETVNSVKSAASSAISYFSKYPEIKISDISGRMKQELIAEEIEKFKNNETQILISTTIIEVGVNVPNATVIAIKSSERFGLAQTHQLRGRVGRGSDQSYCLLQVGDPDDLKADILCNNSDGFEIAKEDMKLRGTGDFIGTSQSGSNKDVMLMLAEPDLYQKISALNDEIYSDPSRMSLYSFLLPQK